MNASYIFVSPTCSFVSPRMHMRLAVPRFVMLLISCCRWDAGALMCIPVVPKTRTRKWPESEDASCDLNSACVAADASDSRHPDGELDPAIS